MTDPGQTQIADTKEAHRLGMFCHLLAFAGFLGILFGNIVGPLVLWLIKKDEIPFVDDQGKEVVNFQISLTIYALIAAPLCLLIVGFVLLGVIWIGGIVQTIIGALRASEGQRYRYPYTIRFLK
ncbi:MAG: DUF4870 domain-containing protein [Planctomycetota bacterium]|jgi:uncharacterized Tic20 family protein